MHKYQPSPVLPPPLLPPSPLPPPHCLIECPGIPSLVISQLQPTFQYAKLISRSQSILCLSSVKMSNLFHSIIFHSFGIYSYNIHVLVGSRYDQIDLYLHGRYFFNLLRKFRWPILSIGAILIQTYRGPICPQYM